MEKWRKQKKEKRREYLIQSQNQCHQLELDDEKDGEEKVLKAANSHHTMNRKIEESPVPTPVAEGRNNMEKHSPSESKCHQLFGAVHPPTEAWKNLQPQLGQMLTGDGGTDL